jgi:hypothetical protein
MAQEVVPDYRDAFGIVVVWDRAGSVVLATVRPELALRNAKGSVLTDENVRVGIPYIVWDGYLHAG